MQARKTQRRTIVLSEAGKKRLGFAGGRPAMIETDQRSMGSAGPEVKCIDIHGRRWDLVTEDIEKIRP